MMDEILLTILGITETVFDSKAVKTTTTNGIPIGIGKCKAVRLQLNEFVKNDTSGTEIANLQIYFGDSQKQDVELKRGTTTHLIITDRLEKIFVSNPFATTAYVQVWIYR